MKSENRIKQEINMLLSRIEDDAQSVKNCVSNLLAPKKDQETTPDDHKFIVVKVKDSEFKNDKNHVEVNCLFREINERDMVIFQPHKIRLRKDRKYLATIVNESYEIRTGFQVGIINPNFLEVITENI